MFRSEGKLPIPRSRCLFRPPPYRDILPRPPFLGQWIVRGHSEGRRAEEGVAHTHTKSEREAAFRPRKKDTQILLLGYTMVGIMARGLPLAWLGAKHGDSGISRAWLASGTKGRMTFRPPRSPLSSSRRESHLKLNTTSVKQCCFELLLIHSPTATVL